MSIPHFPKRLLRLRKKIEQQNLQEKTQLPTALLGGKEENQKKNKLKGRVVIVEEKKKVSEGELGKRKGERGERKKKKMWGKKGIK